jgi:hypothetical protein
MTYRDDDRTRSPLDDYLNTFGAEYARAANRGGASDQPTASVTRTPFRRGRRERGRLVPALGLGTVALGLTAALAIVLLSAGSKVDLVSEARAALGAPGEIVHFAVFVDAPRGQADCPVDQPTEVWQTTSGRARWRMVQPPSTSSTPCSYSLREGVRAEPGPIERSEDGNRLETYVRERNRLRTLTGLPPTMVQTAPLFPGSQWSYAAQGTGSRDVISTVRSMLQHGQLHAVGGSHDDGGTQVQVFQGTAHFRVDNSHAHIRSALTTTFVVDAATYRPLRVTLIGTAVSHAKYDPPQGTTFSQQSTVRFVTYERLPLTPANEHLLSIQTAPRPTVTTESYATELARSQRQQARILAASRRRNGHR